MGKKLSELIEKAAQLRITIDAGREAEEDLRAIAGEVRDRLSAAGVADGSIVEVLVKGQERWSYRQFVVYAGVLLPHSPPKHFTTHELDQCAQEAEAEAELPQALRSIEQQEEPMPAEAIPPRLASAG